MVLAHLLTPRADSQTEIAARAEAWTPGAGFMRKTIAGETVSTSKAMTVSAWFACLRNISEDMGKLPWDLFERVDGGRGKKRADDHPLANILRYDANDESHMGTLVETMQGWALTWGNAYAEIERDGAGNVVAFWPIHPSRCWLHRVAGAIVLDVVQSGTYTDNTRNAVRLPYADVIHIRGFGDDPLTGLSFARLAAESLGIALAAQNYGAAFFGNGAMASIVIIHPKKLDEVGQANLRESWKKKMSGANKNGVAVLWDDMKIEKMSIPPEEAQFLETRQFQVEELSRWFRMPPHKIQSLLRSTNNNIEHQGIEYSTDTLSPWMTRWEREIERKCLDKRDRVRFDIKMNDKALLRGDFKSRMEGYRTGISTGIMTPNEARTAEDWNPSDMPGMDAYFLQGAMTTVERISKGETKPASGQQQSDPNVDPAEKPEPEPKDEPPKPTPAEEK